MASYRGFGCPTATPPARSRPGLGRTRGGISPMAFAHVATDVVRTMGAADFTTSGLSASPGQYRA